MVKQGHGAPVSLSLDLGEGVDLPTVASANHALTALLKDIEENITGEPSRVRWKYMDRARVGAVATPNGVAAEALRQIVEQARAGFERVQKADGAEVSWPSAFGIPAKNAVKKIVRSLDKVSFIQVEARAGEVEEPPVVMRHVTLREDYGTTGPRTEVEAIEGVLDLVSVRKGYQFSVEQHGSGRHVRCHVSPDQLEAAKALLGRRVVVEGLVRYDKNGSPHAISEVRSIWARPASKRQIEELVGTIPDFTGGLDSADYIRRLRGGGEDDGG